MPDAYAELAKEVRDLRAEIRQMRELIDLLVALVVEDDEGDVEDMSVLLTGGAEVPRFNN